MELTKQKIAQIISSGKAEHSPLACAFISEAARQFDIKIAAYYLDTSQILLFDNEFIPTRKIDPRKTQLVNSLSLMLYIQNSKAPAETIQKQYGRDLLTLFKSVMQANGVVLEYPRTFSPEEMRYYGWLGQKASEWDRSKIIHPDAPIGEKEEVVIESFDHLVIWHIFHNGVGIFNSLPVIKDSGAKVFCGWDQSNNLPSLYIILPEEQIQNISERRKMMTSEILMHLHAMDKFQVIHDDAFRPIFATWSSLPESIRFSLLRNTK